MRLRHPTKSLSHIYRKCVPIMANLVTSTPSVGGMLPVGHTGDLLLTALRETSVAYDPRVATQLIIDAHSVSLPVLTADASGTWTPEATELTESSPVFAEVVVTPSKVAALSIVSSELANDSNPAVAATVGQSLAQGLAASIDSALFAATTAPNAPAGIGSLAGTSSVSAGAKWSSLDPLSDAMSIAEANGAQVTAVVTNYADAKAISQIKERTDSQRPLLGVEGDAATPGQRMAFGVPILVSRWVPAGTAWAIPAARLFTVTRQDLTVESSTDAYFSSDRVAMRGIARVGFAVTRPSTITKIALSS